MFNRFCSNSFVNRPMAFIAIIIAIVAACASGNHAHAQTKWAATPYPDAAHERFSVTVTGTGPDAILIPGLASSAAVWDGTVAHLKGHYRLHVLNLAGFAGEPAGANASGEILTPAVEALDAYIKANHLKSPVVIGHSMGGLMSLMLAKSHPEDADKLIIVDSLPFIGVIFNPQATVATITPAAISMRDGMEQMPADAFAAQQTGMTARMVSGADNQKTVLDWSVSSDRHVVAQTFYEDMTTDLRPVLATIKTPTTLFFPVATAYGQTAATTEPVYKNSYNGLPNLTLVHFDNSLHFIMLDQPDAFYTAVDAALK